MKLLPPSPSIPLPRAATDARGLIAPAALNVREAAQYIGMSVSWLKHSDVPRVRLGSRVKWLREDLDTYLRNHRSHGSAA